MAASTLCVETSTQEHHIGRLPQHRGQINIGRNSWMVIPLLANQNVKPMELIERTAASSTSSGGNSLSICVDRLRS